MKMQFVCFCGFISFSFKIHTFHDTVYLHFHHVSLRKNKKKSKEKPFIKNQHQYSKNIPKQRILFSMDSTDRWGMEGK